MTDNDVYSDSAPKLDPDLGLLENEVNNEEDEDKTFTDFNSENKIKTSNNYDANLNSNNPYNIKKFRTAYIIFCSERRSQLKKESPDAKNPEITKKMAYEWKHMDPQEKEKYKKLEREDLDRFKQEKEARGVYKYNVNPKNRKPIRYRTAFMFYLSSHKEKLKNAEKFQNIDLIKELSKKWKEMTDEEKEPFNQMALQDKERYNNELVDYMLKCFNVKDKVKKKKEKINSFIESVTKPNKNIKQVLNILPSIKNINNIHDLGIMNLDYLLNGKFILEDKSGKIKLATNKKNHLFEINKGRKGSRLCKIGDDDLGEEYVDEELENDAQEYACNNFKRRPGIKGIIKPCVEKNVYEPQGLRKDHKYFFDLDDVVDAKLSHIKLKNNSNLEDDRENINDRSNIYDKNYLNNKKNVKVRSESESDLSDKDDDEYEDFEKHFELDDELENEFLDQEEVDIIGKIDKPVKVNNFNNENNKNISKITNGNIGNDLIKNKRSRAARSKKPGNKKII